MVKKPQGEGKAADSLQRLYSNIILAGGGSEIKVAPRTPGRDFDQPVDQWSKHKHLTRVVVKWTRGRMGRARAGRAAHLATRL